MRRGFSNGFTVTPKNIIDGWEKYGDGSDLPTAFVEALAKELSKPWPTLPVHHDFDAGLVNRTIGFQVGMVWKVLFTIDN